MHSNHAHRARLRSSSLLHTHPVRARDLSVATHIVWVTALFFELPRAPRARDPTNLGRCHSHSTSATHSSCCHLLHLVWQNALSKAKRISPLRSHAPTSNSSRPRVPLADALGIYAPPSYRPTIWAQSHAPCVRPLYSQRSRTVLCNCAGLPCFARPARDQPGLPRSHHNPAVTALLIAQPHASCV